MAQANPNFTADEVRALRQRYLDGTLSPRGRAAFEEKFPHLIPQPSPTPRQPLAAPFLQIPGPGGVGTFDFPTGEDPEELEAFRTGETQTMRTAAPVALGTMGGLGGAALYTRALPFLGRFAPALGEAAGSLVARKIGTETGLEEPGVVGDIAAGAIPLAGGIAGAGFRSVRQWLVPSLPEGELATLGRPLAGRVSPAERLRTPLETRQEVIRTPLLYDQGSLVQEGIQQNREFIRGVAKQYYAPVSVPIGTKNPFVNLRPAEDMAQRLNTSLDEFGAEVEAGIRNIPLPPTTRGTFTQSPAMGGGPSPIPQPGGIARIRYDETPIDEAITIRANLGADIRTIERQAADRQDRIRLRTLQRMKSLVDREIEGAAKRAGVSNQLHEADQFFKTEVADRFYDKVISDVLNASGEEVIKQLPRLSVDDAKQYLRSLTALGGGERSAVKEGRVGSVTALLAKATTRTGVIRPDVILNELERADPHVRAIIFGPETADALYNFASNLGKGRMRSAMAIGAVSEAATIGTAAAAHPGAAVGAGLEVLNELNWLGRMFVNRPSVNKAMVGAILTGRDAALRKITGLQTVRIVGTQAGLRSFLVSPMSQPGGP